MELSNEKKFTIVDSKEMRTLAFLINEPDAGSPCATIQKLEYLNEDSSNEFKKTFYVSQSDSLDICNDKNILLLTLEKEKAYLHMAVLKEDELYVSKEPAKVSYKVLKTEHSALYQDIKYTPNFKRPISIIDPEVADEVKPVLFFDEEANMVRARVKLLPDKSYITLEVLKEEDGTYTTNYAICTFE